MLEISIILLLGSFSKLGIISIILFLHDNTKNKLTIITESNLVYINNNNVISYKFLSTNLLFGPVSLSIFKPLLYKLGSCPN